ncbi:uncharacterized protein EV420DRAFT_1645803 [Desarmillaria tabescens]|uniref:C2H2-type domain-containing protein n=1 Tax=Armillaria tabescens TaxID=1929756 RepID=A0AA39K2H1_ARMTA|nr:uncharacterized protein EV420DRAFT_1645803 [Desarmillaria tabescens]KAK0452156.1 hypothetical protein EV420DRAFT_1645803 [Desarmillaria tabescens]
MSCAGLEDINTQNLQDVSTGNDHSMQDIVPLTHALHPQSFAPRPQYATPDRNDDLYYYLSQDKRRLWAYSGDIPFAYGTIEADWRTTQRHIYKLITTEEEVPMTFDINIPHQHSDPPVVCFSSLSTRQFWQMYSLQCSIPGNNYPPIDPNADFIPAVPVPLQASQSTFYLDDQGPLDTSDGLAFPDDSDGSHSFYDVKQEREIFPVPHDGSNRGSAAGEEATLPTFAHCTDLGATDRLDGKRKHSFDSISSGVEAPSSSSSLTAFSPSPSPSRSPTPTADQVSYEAELRCIYPDCLQLFHSIVDVTDHLKSLHNGSYARSYRCAFPSCSQTFKNKTDFPRHALTMNHKPQRSFKCAGCNGKFTRYGA